MPADCVRRGRCALGVIYVHPVQGVLDGPDDKGVMHVWAVHDGYSVSGVLDAQRVLNV